MVSAKKCFRASSITRSRGGGGGGATALQTDPEALGLDPRKTGPRELMQTKLLAPLGFRNFGRDRCLPGGGFGGGGLGGGDLIPIDHRDEAKKPSLDVGATLQVTHGHSPAPPDGAGRGL